MVTTSRIAGVACGALILGCLLACGLQRRMLQNAAEEEKRENDLAQLGVAMRAYHDANGAFPPDQGAFVAWAQQADPSVVEIIQNREYTIFYAKDAKVKLEDLPDGGKDVVLAHDNKARSTTVRKVLFADGHVACSARTSSASRASTSTSSCTAGPGRTSAARRRG
jgi:hypothetical protein